jgi:proline iminopeptidase
LTALLKQESFCILYCYQPAAIQLHISIICMKKIIIALTAWLLFFACNSQQQGKRGNDDAAKKVEEKLLMDIGGTKQYVEITGESDKNPVLLFIHGGPGWPQTPQLRYFNAGLTKYFTLATWDQRGCGKSYLHDSVAKNVTLEQITADAYELTQLLQQKFGQKKIFLAGFSWGSIIGVTLAQKHPEAYAAYVGISQVINMRQGMQATQNWLRENALQKKDAATLKILEWLGRSDSSVCKTPLDCFMKQYELVAQYKGAVFNPRSDTMVGKAITQYDDYKNYDWNKGFFYSARLLEKDLFAADFSGVTKINIPVYFMAGRHDWNVPAVMAEAFVKKLQAPHKEIIWFENSGHGPLEEEPEKFNAVLVEKLIKDFR